MKVLRAPSTAWSSKVNCATCHAELEVELADLKRVQGFDQRDNDSWDYATFTCPVCHRVTQSAPLLKSIPEFLRDKLGRK